MAKLSESNVTHHYEYDSYKYSLIQVCYTIDSNTTSDIIIGDIIFQSGEQDL